MCETIGAYFFIIKPKWLSFIGFLSLPNGFQITCLLFEQNSNKNLT